MIACLGNQPSPWMGESEGRGPLGPLVAYGLVVVVGVAFFTFSNGSAVTPSVSAFI